MAKRKDYSANAFEIMGKTWHVAQRNPKASDDNPGTKTRPFKTITKAASVVDMGDVVVIGEGTYREEVPLVRNGHPYVPESFILFKAVSGKKVYLKGSDVFAPEWRELGGGVFAAKLPDSLSKDGAYNPHEWSGVIDDPRKVRPTEETILPETLGQIYVEGEALEQLNSTAAVAEKPGSFVVSADGREIIVHFRDGKVPSGRRVELTVRERCFKAQFRGTVFVQTMGLVAEHAANPGVLSYARPLTIRRNAGKGIAVRKTFVRHSTVKTCAVVGLPSYMTKRRSKLIASMVDDTGPGLAQSRAYTVESGDAGRTWERTGDFFRMDQSMPDHFFDESKDRLVRYYRKDLQGPDLDGAFGARNHDNMIQVSSDGGKTWSAPERVDHGNYYFRIIRLHDSTLLWSYTDNQIEGRHHSRFNVRLGKWRGDLSGIDWEKGGSAEVDPKQCSSGLDEPQACQFPDGRVFVLIRAGNVLPTQDSPGVPSVKLFIVSADGGRSWTEPKPLTYEDGSYVYSPRSYPDCICSSKNGKVYVLLNISGSTVNCDPRTVLNIAELDTELLSVKRNTVAVIAASHEEHHSLIRLSNWVAMEDRYTKNLLLFMKLHMSEYCSVRKGYDFSLYRYEIKFGENT